MKLLVKKLEAALEGLTIYEQAVRWRTEKAQEILRTEGYSDEYYHYVREINRCSKIATNIKLYLGISLGVIGYNDINADPNSLNHNILTNWYQYHINKENELLKAEQLEQNPEKKEDWLDKINKLYQ